MGDEIKSELGDGVQNANIGKGNRQRVDDRSNVVNNYIDRERSGGISTDERLDHLEAISNKTQSTLSRIVALMDGDPTWRIVGFPDQLSAYIKANEDWKKATEKRVIENEERITHLEQGRQIVLSPTQATLLLFVAIAAIIATYFMVTLLQGSI